MIKMRAPAAVCGGSFFGEFSLILGFTTLKIYVMISQYESADAQIWDTPT